MGNLDQPVAPGEPPLLGHLQQILQGIADIEGVAGARGLVGAEGFQPIQQPVFIHRQPLHPGAKARLQQKGEQQMLHIHRPVAPAAGLLLAGEQQIPGAVAEAIGGGGEAGGGAGKGVGRHGAQAAVAGAASWISSTRYPSGSSTKAITVEPCFIGPGGRTTLPPFSAMAPQVLSMSATPMAMCP